MKKIIYTMPETEIVQAVSLSSDLLADSIYGEPGQDLEMLDGLSF